MCLKDIFAKRPIKVVEIPVEPKGEPMPESVEAQLGHLLKSPQVDIQNLNPETKVVLLEVSKLIAREVGKPAVITNAKRTVEEQKAMMERLKKGFGIDYYNRVYGRFERSGGKIEDLPHVNGRAGDFRYSGYQKAISALHHLNDLYLSSVQKVIGYVPSVLVVIEENNCFHIQTARGITDANRTAYIDFMKEIIARA